MPNKAVGGRLLVITGAWPTPDRPSAGVFVQCRLVGVDATVVGPRNYSEPAPLRYIDLLWRALTTRGRFRGVEAHMLFPSGLIGLLSARLRRVPLVVYAHGSDVRVTARRNWLYFVLSRLVARHADAVVTNSESTAEMVRALGREPLVVPPGVDLRRFHPSPRPNDGSVLYIGGRRLEKGYDRAIGIATTLAGPKIDEKRPDEVPALIASHDVVLIPSRAEGFGLAAAEAIASGRWVVAANVDGLRSLIINGVNGTLVSDEDFAQAVLGVPDYDPWAVAATASPFSDELHRSRMAETWDLVFASRCARSS